MTADRHQGCLGCDAPAVVCRECVRAIALQWFGAVARHPDTGAGIACRLCDQGPADYCGHCFVDQVAAYRTVLRQAGTRIGEPASWP
jgi:hypothetical protein